MAVCCDEGKYHYLWGTENTSLGGARDTTGRYGGAEDTTVGVGWQRTLQWEGEQGTLLGGA